MNLTNILQKLEKNKYQEYLPTSKPKGKGASFFSKVFMEKLKQETLAEDCRIILLNPAKKLEQPLKDLGYKVFVVPFPLYEGKVKFIQQFGEIVKNK